MAGRYIQGAELAGKEGTWQQRVVGAGYQQVRWLAGSLAVWPAWAAALGPLPQRASCSGIAARQLRLQTAHTC